MVERTQWCMLKHMNAINIIYRCLGHQPKLRPWLPTHSPFNHSSTKTLVPIWSWRANDTPLVRVKNHQMDYACFWCMLPACVRSFHPFLNINHKIHFHAQSDKEHFEPMLVSLFASQKCTGYRLREAIAFDSLTSGDTAALNQDALNSGKGESKYPQGLLYYIS